MCLVPAHVSCCVWPLRVPPTMRTMPTHLWHTRPWNCEGRLWYQPPWNCEGRLWYQPPRGRAHLHLVAFIGYSQSPQTNTSLLCTFCPHSCALGKYFPVGHCGGINPYTLTARLGPGGLAHYETSSRLDPTAQSFAQGNKTWRSSRILVG